MMMMIMMIDEETIKLIGVVKNIRKLKSRVCPSLLMNIFFLPTKEEHKERRDTLVAVQRGTLWRDCPNNSTPKTKKKACKAKALTTIKTWDNSSSENEAQHKRRSHKRSSSRSPHVCLMARSNIETPSSSESDSDDDEKPSYEELAQTIKFFVEICTKQKKQLSELNSKYASLKAKTKNCDNTTDMQIIKIIDDLNAKLGSS